VEDRKQGRRKRSYLVSLAGTEPDHLIKVNEYRDLPWWRRLGRSKARRDLDRAAAIAARGIPTPIPLVVGETRRGVLLERCHELVPWLGDAIDLRRARDEGIGMPGESRARAAALGMLVRRMHESGIDQRDLAPNNFLWRRAGEPLLLAIDFERARVGAAVRPRARIAALAKLDRHCAGAPASERMRFLRGYCAGDRVAARSLWRAIEAESASLLRRDAARWRRTATRRGRRFEPVGFPIGARGWRGWMRRGASLDALVRAIERRDAPGASLRLYAIEPGTTRNAARVWGLALALYQRAVVPEPIAAIYADGHAWLALAPTTTSLEAADRPALAILLDRLLTWGGIAETLQIEAIGCEGPRAVLLDPSALRTQDPPVASGRRLVARRLAEWLLATPIRDDRGARDGSSP
jgi:tRNA A-37 threonylcarbamoyl transferase component Bud32